MNKLGFLIPLLSSLIMLAACQSVAEEKMALSIADLYENASQTQQAIPGLDTQPLLSKMHLHVIALQNELKSLDKRIEKTQASRSTQTGIMLNDSIFERLILEMNELQKAMKPLCQELEGVSLPFDLNSFETAMPETEFGQPPLANQVILQQLSTDVQESERAILEAIVAHKNEK
ncbi:MAG: hypothetical protein AAFN10_20345 [Bacteroidota bacterium]